MRILFILSVFYSGLVFATSKDGDSLYTETVELMMGSKKVFILGFIHGGPKSYFQNQRLTMQNWINKSTDRVTILTELYTCHTAVAEFKDGSKINKAQIELLGGNLGADFLFVKSVLGDRADTSNCVLDIDGIHLRPSYVVERNLLAREEAAGMGLEIQWTMQYPREPSVNVRSGDLVMDLEPIASQVVGSMGYRSKEYIDPDDSVPVWRRLFDSYMTNYRNKHLFREVMKELLSVDRVIIPWGGDHREGLEKLLMDQGFVVSSRGGVRYASPKDGGLSEEFRESLESYLKEAVPMSPLCGG
jgi:hypothetical protein